MRAAAILSAIASGAVGFGRMTRDSSEATVAKNGRPDCEIEVFEMSKWTSGSVLSLTRPTSVIEVP